MPHGTVVKRGKQKADADGGDGLLDNFRLCLQAHPEVFQQIGAAAPARDRAIAVLGHGHAAARHHKSRRGGDIERMGAVTASPAGVHHGRRRCLNPQSLFTHGLGRSGQFGKGFPFGGQGRHEGPDLGIGYLAGQDAIHHLMHF